MSLSVIFDHEQQRLSRDRTWVTANGDLLAGSIEGAPYSNTILDPITSSLWLKPYFFDDAWETSNAGNYAKLALSSFTPGTGALWEERSNQASAGPWLCLKDTTDVDTLITTSAFGGKNRGVSLGWFQYAATGNREIFRCGWNSTASDANGVSVRYYENGQAVVFKDGEEVGGGQVPQVGASPSDSNIRFHEVIMLPCRHRELLIMNRRGEGFAVEFLDIDPDDADPTIVGATKFWYEAKTGGTMVQIAPISFPTSGYAHSQQVSFHTPPASGATLESFAQPTWPGGSGSYRVWGHPAYVGTQTVSVSLYELDGTTAFTPDGTEKEVRLRTTIGTDNAGYTPFIYGNYASYPPAFDVTDDSEAHDGTLSITRATLSVPDDAAGVRLDLEIWAPGALESDVAAFRTMCNRSIQAVLGADTVILDGFGSPPHEEISLDDDVGTASLEIRDYWKNLEHHCFRDPIPLDGVTLQEILESLALLSGCADTDVSDAGGFVMAPDPGPNANEWAEQIEMGESAAEVIERLISKYAANWIYGFRPTAAGTVFYALDPDDLPTTEDITLYRTTAEAISVGGHDPADAHKFVYWSESRDANEPEATEVRVTGVDPRTGRPFQAFKVDTAAETVTTAPSARPANWVGGIRPYGIAIPEAHEQTTVNRATNVLYDRLTPAELLSSIRCFLLLFQAGDDEGYPLWRGRCVRLYGRGRYRILSIGCDFVLEEDSGLIWRNAQYALKRIGDEPEE